MIMVCHRTKFDVPNYNGVLAITTKPKAEEKISQCRHVTFNSTKELVMTNLKNKLHKQLVYTSRML